MLPHQERVVQEKDDLDAKITALNRFICGSEAFPDLPAAEQGRLNLQLATMLDYSGILADRIAAFPQT